MSKQHEALELALEALEDYQANGAPFFKCDSAVSAIREALAEPEPARKPLTDAEIADLWDGHVVPVFGKNGINPIVFARAVERAHGIIK